MVELKVGDRVRAKARTIFGWKGTGTVEWVTGDHVAVRKDGDGHENKIAEFCRYQVAKMRKQK